MLCQYTVINVMMWDGVVLIAGAWNGMSWFIGSFHSLVDHPLFKGWRQLMRIPLASLLVAMQNMQISSLCLYRFLLLVLWAIR